MWQLHSQPSGCGNGSVRKIAPLSPHFVVAVPDVGNAQIKEAAYSVQIRRCFKNDLRLVGGGAAADVDNQPSIRER